ncbi:hypothetical protein Q5H92_19535 [Hymenobacter sp. M29]|uniref:Uncharacterized protein n=1 Tax=Hymenobacter mellowenesis TaxID=3063995 RepID=A0ABT9AGV9_9BACT|nr:hypothetical protein [Hymenobacter sp. M29]MDO7848569.1 hypothetical protein [Hymenobacter sp. M29]
MVIDLFFFVYPMSAQKEIILFIFLTAGMLALPYFYARYLMLKSVFVQQLNVMHARMAQEQPLECVELEPESILWQTALGEASIRARSRVVWHHLAHPVYRDAVIAYEALEARIHIGMLLTVLASGVLIALV